MDYNGKTPIAEVLMKMAGEAPNWDLTANLMCMIGEVEAQERHTCTYCKSIGHKRKYCPVFYSLWEQFRGDREVNKIRGRMSVDLRF